MCAPERVEHCAQFHCQCHGHGHGHVQCQNTKKPNNPQSNTPSPPHPCCRSATLAHSYPGEACLASKTNFWLSSSMPSCLNLVECVASFSLVHAIAVPPPLLCFMISILIVREKYNDLERYLHLSFLANLNSFLVPGTLAIKKLFYLNPETDTVDKQANYSARK